MRDRNRFFFSPTYRVRITQEQLHLYYLFGEEYMKNGYPPFFEYNSKLDSDFEYVDLLDYLPNPSKIKFQKHSVGIYDVYALLPTF